MANWKEAEIHCWYPGRYGLALDKDNNPVNYKNLDSYDISETFTLIHGTSLKIPFEDYIRDAEKGDKVLISYLEPNSTPVEGIYYANLCVKRHCRILKVLEKAFKIDPPKPRFLSCDPYCDSCGGYGVIDYELPERLIGGPPTKSHKIKSICECVKAVEHE